MMNDIVIIGGGVAAFNAIKAIREINQDVKVHLIQNETLYPYYRIKLTKSLFETLDTDKILLQKKDWYETNKISVYLGKEVVTIDTDNKKVALNDGTSLEYGKLLLANGAYNFTPPIEGIDKKNIFTIRKYEDIQNIRSQIDDKNTILNLGGGIQNLEAAWAVSQQGKNVVIAEFMDRLMPRQLDTRASEILKNAVERFHIKVLLNTEVVKLIGDSEVQGAMTKADNKIDCDMVIYSVGIRPDKRLYENTPIETDKGVLVNHRMQTNLPDVYAAGDIAELDGRVGGLWTIAGEQGKVAGYNMVGKDAFYSASIPVTTMNAFQLSVFSVGTFDEAGCSLSLTEDNSDGAVYKRLFIKDNKLVGAIVIGDTKSNTLLKNYVINQKELPDIDITGLSVSKLLEALKGIN